MRAELERKCDKNEEKVTPLYKDMFMKKKRSILRKISHLLPASFLDKTAVCKHDHGCFENVVRKALYTFTVGFLVQAVIRNAGLILINPVRFLRIL